MIMRWGSRSAAVRQVKGAFKRQKRTARRVCKSSGAGERKKNMYSNLMISTDKGDTIRLATLRGRVMKVVSLQKEMKDLHSLFSRYGELELSWADLMTVVMALLLSSGFFSLSLADWSSIVHRALGLSAFLQVNKKRWTKANQSVDPSLTSAEKKNKRRN